MAGNRCRIGFDRGNIRPDRCLKGNQWNFIGPPVLNCGDCTKETCRARSAMAGGFAGKEEIPLDCTEGVRNGPVR